MNPSAISSFSPIEIFDNAVLFWALIACGFAQITKVIVELIQHQRWRPAVLFETGGMPSSHSALMTGTASGIGLELGFSDPVFALAATVAFIVMYDASGIRQSAGLIAQKVNQLQKINDGELTEGILKENLGHTKSQVIVGSLVGPLVVLPGIFFIGSPINLLHLIGIFSS